MFWLQTDSGWVDFSPFTNSFSAQPEETCCAALSHEVRNRMTQCSERLVKGLICFKYLSAERGGEATVGGWGGGEQRKEGLGGQNWLKTLFHQDGGLLRLEVSAMAVFINNAIHMRATSWPYTFFSNLRHGGSSPRVSTHFQWQQGGQPGWTRELTPPAVLRHLSFPSIGRLTVFRGLDVIDARGTGSDVLWQEATGTNTHVAVCAKRKTHKAARNKLRVDVSARSFIRQVLFTASYSDGKWWRVWCFITTMYNLPRQEKKGRHSNQLKVQELSPLSLMPTFISDTPYLTSFSIASELF